MTKPICMFSFSSDMCKEGIFSHTEFKNFQNSKPCDSESKAAKKGLPRVKTNYSHAKIQTCIFQDCRPICHIPVKNPADHNSFLFHNL